MLDSGDVSQFFKYASSKFTCKESVAPLHDDDGSVIESSLGRSNHMNNVFSSVFVTDDGMTPDMGPVRFSQECTSVVITEAAVIKQISSFKNLTSAGPDGFPPFLLKKA